MHAWYWRKGHSWWRSAMVGPTGMLHAHAQAFVLSCALGPPADIFCDAITVICSLKRKVQRKNKKTGGEGPLLVMHEVPVSAGATVPLPFLCHTEMVEVEVPVWNWVVANITTLNPHAHPQHVPTPPLPLPLCGRRNCGGRSPRVELGRRQYNAHGTRHVGARDFACVSLPGVCLQIIADMQPGRPCLPPSADPWVNKRRQQARGYVAKRRSNPVAYQQELARNREQRRTAEAHQKPSTRSASNVVWTYQFEEFFTNLGDQGLSQAEVEAACRRGKVDTIVLATILCFSPPEVVSPGLTCTEALYVEQQLQVWLSSTFPGVGLHRAVHPRREASLPPPDCSTLPDPSQPRTHRTGHCVVGPCRTCMGSCMGWHGLALGTSAPEISLV